MYAVNPKYYDLAEVRKESKLWRAAEKKHPWYDAPAKVKVIRPNNQNINLNISRFYIFLPYEKNW